MGNPCQAAQNIPGEAEESKALGSCWGCPAAPVRVQTMNGFTFVLQDTPHEVVGAPKVAGVGKQNVLDFCCLN
jgi:hypothetical protein